jgi:hypothetical protein
MRDPACGPKAGVKRALSSLAYRAWQTFRGLTSVSVKAYLAFAPLAVGVFG